MKRRSILCPNCKKLISSYEQTCPYCGISAPGAWWRNVALVTVYLSPPYIVRTIIGVNCLLFAVSILLSLGTMDFSMNPFTLLSPSNQILLFLGATGTFPIIQFHRWWTLISASYLHGGILHIFFNMVVLYQIAPLVIQEYGSNRMIIIYTLGGTIGFFVSFVAGIPFTIGASASLFALIGAILYYAKSRGGSYGQIIFKQISSWVIALFFLGFLIPGINNWAHGGGLVGGILLGFLVSYNEKKQETRYHKIISTICLALTFIILLRALISTLYYYFTLS